MTLREIAAERKRLHQELAHISDALVALHILERKRRGTKKVSAKKVKNEHRKN